MYEEIEADSRTGTDSAIDVEPVNRENAPLSRSSVSCALFRLPDAPLVNSLIKINLHQRVPHPAFLGGVGFFVDPIIDPASWGVQTTPRRNSHIGLALVTLVSRLYRFSYRFPSP